MFSVLRRFIGSDSGVIFFSERAGRIILLLRECYKSPSVQKPLQEGTLRCKAWQRGDSDDKAKGKLQHAGIRRALVKLISNTHVTNFSFWRCA